MRSNSFTSTEVIFLFFIKIEILDGEIQKIEFENSRCCRNLLSVKTEVDKCQTRTEDCKRWEISYSVVRMIWPDRYVSNFTWIFVETSLYFTSIFYYEWFLHFNTSFFNRNKIKKIWKKFKNSWNKYRKKYRKNWLVVDCQSLHFCQ